MRRRSPTSSGRPSPGRERSVTWAVVGGRESGSHGDGFRVAVRGPEQTAAVAGVLARALVPGDAVLLSGDLAAGKTTFVTAAVAALGSEDVVTSPTFTIANSYAAPAGPVLHIDTYRLDDVAAFRDLGLEEYLESAIAFVEWGELVAAELAELAALLHVHLAAVPENPDGRLVTVRAGAPRWDAALSGLHDEIVVAL